MIGLYIRRGVGEYHGCLGDCNCISLRCFACVGEVNDPAMDSREILERKGMEASSYIPRRFISRIMRLPSVLRPW